MIVMLRYVCVRLIKSNSQIEYITSKLLFCSTKALIWYWIQISSHIQIIWRISLLKCIFSSGYRVTGNISLLKAHLSS